MQFYFLSVATWGVCPADSFSRVAFAAVVMCIAVWWVWHYGWMRLIVLYLLPVETRARIWFAVTWEGNSWRRQGWKWMVKSSASSSDRDRPGASRLWFRYLQRGNIHNLLPPIFCPKALTFLSFRQWIFIFSFESLLEVWTTRSPLSTENLWPGTFVRFLFILF